MVNVTITREKLDAGEVIGDVMRPDCGGIVVFIGTIRDSFEGKKVRRIEVEAYDEMAVDDLKKILQEAVMRHKAAEASISHRTGKLNVGDIVVVVAVSAPHRREAFQACKDIIDRMKQTTPIWKQEFFEGGSQWVGGGEAHGEDG